MKHLLNNISHQEKKNILEQHKGGIVVSNKNFQKLLTNKLGNVKPIMEVVHVSQSHLIEQQTEETKTITNKVATEGIKNVTPEMISSPQFKGTYSGYVFGGVFNGVNYQWDCNGVEGMSGVRGLVEGEIITETLENTLKAIQKPNTDGKPGTLCVGFYNDGNSNLIIYTTTSNKPKCLYF